MKCHEHGKTCIDSHSQDRLPKRSNGFSLTFVGAKVICGSVWDGKDGGSGKDKVIVGKNTGQRNGSETKNDLVYFKIFPLMNLKPLNH